MDSYNGCDDAIPLPIRRSPARLKSFRKGRRFPAHLQKRRTSLETIDSVTTTHSRRSEDEEEESDSYKAAGPQPEHSITQNNPQELPTPNSTKLAAPPVCSWSGGSKESPRSQAVASWGSKGLIPHSPKTIFQKIKHSSAKAIPSNSPDHLIIQRTVSIDRSSHFVNISNIEPCSSDRTQPGSVEDERGLSASSGEWSASSFDTTNLTESEVKMCKKKGINPSLYVEMKATRKGKWTSPIAGNSFL